MSAGRIAVLASALAAGALADVAPCADPADYDATATANLGSLCSTAVTMFDAFTPDATTCFEDVTVSGSTLPRAVWLSNSLQACCGSGQTACDPYKLNPCANASAFNRDAMFDASQGLTCGAASSLYGAAFVASAQTCDEQVGEQGSQTARKMFTAQLAPACCDDGEDACAAFSMNPCATPGSFRPDATFDENTCAEAMTFLPSFTPSAATCLEEMTLSGSGNAMGTRSAALAQAAAACCTGGVSVCAQFVGSTSGASSVARGAGALLAIVLSLML